MSWHMSPEDARDSDTLRVLAGLCGVETSYHDIYGQTQHASDEALLALLTSLGYDASSPGAARDAAEAVHQRRISRRLDRITVAWGGRGELRLGIERSSRAVRVQVKLQDGGELSDERRADALHDLAAGDGTPQRLGYVLPWTLPPGYHGVRVEFDSQVLEGEVWSAPMQVWQGDDRPGWGLFAPTYALRSERNAGVGDFADLSAFAAWVGEQGGRMVGTLPLLPTFLDQPFDPSPYAPVSRLFWNELYLAVDDLPEFANDSGARRLWEGNDARAALADLRALGQVDYRRAMGRKRELLTNLAANAWEHAATRQALEAHVDKRPELGDYATFRAAFERQGRPFCQWPAAQRQGQLRPSDYDPQCYRYHCYVQWRSEQQLAAVAQTAAERGARLYLDLPLGAHADGYDAWRHAGVLVQGCAAGAPPDELFRGGQDWGFSPLHPEASEQTGHRYFRECLAHGLKHAGTLRIDHVMGLHRMFCVPRGLAATDGIYLRQPSEQLYASICIESHRHRAYVVGEDLGTVPDEVRHEMDRHGLGRLYVSQYESHSASRGPSRSLANTVASLNTHDMPTYAGYWRGGDIDQRVELGLTERADAKREMAEREQQRESRCAQLHAPAGDASEADRDGPLLSAELAALAESDARWLLVNVEDLWLERRPQNVPGTGPEASNWRRKLALTLNELKSDRRVAELLARVDRPARHGQPAPDRGAPAVHASLLSDVDLHLFNEGTHRRLYECLGSHLGRHGDEEGCFFAVWAPNAVSVSVIGDFNGWRAEATPLFKRADSGVWEGFVPRVTAGMLYKYRLETADGRTLEKADPLARQAEVPPRTASRVTESNYVWGDADWVGTRAERNALQAPTSIYEVHLGSWRRAADGGMLGYRELAEPLIAHVRTLGFTHVELMPIMEHPYYGSWGYQVTGYFAASGRQGTPDDLRYLIDQLHQAEIGVILDWVPGHFPEDAHGLARFDGTALYEHADPRQGFHPDWKSAIFNYGRLEVRSFLISSALYWIDAFHVDGLRVDGVASMLYLDYSRADGEWIPNVHGGRENLEAIDFLRKLNEAFYEEHPHGQTSAEESTSWPMVSHPTFLGGLGFGTKWDLGWMHDTLHYFAREPVHRKYHQDQLTFRSMYAWHENFVLPLSHDEVVHGKGSLLGRMPGDQWRRFANLRLLYAYMFASPGHKLLFMGSELAPETEWDHEASLDWGLLADPMRHGVMRCLSELNRLYRGEAALHALDQRPAGFAWVECGAPELSVLAFERIAPDGARVLCAFNLTPVPREGYRIGVEKAGYWRELLNTDAREFGGSGVGNWGGLESQAIPALGRANSLSLTLPPLASVWLRSPD